ncbi:hypothetical protein MKW94_024089 [Papaver nudicaule]|uniref:CoA carboxyltransferase N-terminal domain-containing protein n=1 Tax=Papaver nudicaule TaxID=74823 RepID=A0AA41RWU8_PAPNU|nr:hypothetical protein [Papaver nudicaule]
MEKRWFHSILFNEELKHRSGLSKSMHSLGPIENTSESEDPAIYDTEKNIDSWDDSDNTNSNNRDTFFDVRDIRSFISDDIFLVRDRNGNSYSIYFNIENFIFEIDNDRSFMNELESAFYSYLNNGSQSDNHYYDRYMYDTQYSWNNHIFNCIDSYLRSEISIDNYISGGSDNYSDSYMYSYICNESVNSSDNESSSIRISTNRSDFNMRRRYNDLDINKKYRHLWVQCESCYGLNYKKFFKSKLNVCEQCGYHLKMSSSDRIELSTWFLWTPLNFIQKRNLIKIVSILIKEKQGQLNGIPIAIGVMDFQFMGGSMGSVVGEKITRLIEHASRKALPLIIVCASGGARMQEGSLSLMQMAKISSASYNYQSNKKLFYVSILTSPTTGGVTASFGMLGDIIIAEPNAYIAFAGKRVIEQTLNKTVPDGSQAAEYLFHKGLLDSIVPRNLLKSVLSELFQLHGFFPLNQNSIK